MQRRVWWAAALAAVMLVPVVITEVRTGSHLMATLSSGLGVLALSALIATVVAPSRIRSLTAAFGVERIMGLHRWLGILAVVLVVMHLLVAVSGHPQLINPGTLTDAAKAGWSSTAALLLTGWVAVRARRPGARYEIWARAHVALAAAGLVLEARSPIDLVPEGIRHTDHAFVMGVQWHPEFHPNASNENEPVLDSGPLLMAFLKAALRRAGRVRQLADRVARVRERASELVGR